MKGLSVMIIVSACLAGVECRYNGSSATIPKVVDLVIKGEAIPICPEVLAGLPTPRPPVEQVSGKIVSEAGEDQTEDYIAGAKIGLEIALLSHCKKAILKSNSPTCGCGRIYDGTFSGKLVQGEGVFSKLLKESGIEVSTEEIFISA
nr:DUF523 domain-containing protein [Pelosinus sp. IPA-1]